MNRLGKILPLLIALCAFLPPPGPAQTPPPESAVYGAYPQNYPDILTAWLATALVDPKSVKVKWLTDPKPGTLTVKDQKVAGYLVDFSVNARNVFGTYTGPQKHTALIRDGKVVTATGFVYR
jgi:hypothetical protein